MGTSASKVSVDTISPQRTANALFHQQISHDKKQGRRPPPPPSAPAPLSPRPGGGLRWAQAWHQTPFGRYALQWEADDGKITVTAANPPNAAAKIGLEPGAKLLETDGLTFAEQNGCPTAQVGSGQYRVSYTMEQ